MRTGFCWERCTTTRRSCWSPGCSPTDPRSCDADGSPYEDFLAGMPPEQLRMPSAGPAPAGPGPVRRRRLAARRGIGEPDPLGGEWLAEVVRVTEDRRGFWVMCPDELESNRPGVLLDATGRSFTPVPGYAGYLVPDGRVMEAFSKHLCASADLRPRSRHGIRLIPGSTDRKGSRVTTLADTWGVHESQFWLRGKQPQKRIKFNPELGMWDVFGHPEAHQLLSDPATFSSDTTRLIPKEYAADMAELNAGNILQVDPPLHNKMRKLISRAFTPKVVTDLEPRIVELTRELLDAAADRGRLELVTDLAYPLPVIVIAELLGVPASDRYLFKQWVDAMFESSVEFSLTEQNEEQERALGYQLEQTRKLTAYLGAHVDERRAKPREDLISKLVEAEVDGEHLGRTEIVNFANVLLLAGHITTTMLLGNTVLCLDSHPDQFERVRADRSVVPAVIEESLRFLSPFSVVVRATNTEVEMGGVTIPADQILKVWVAVANRDDRVFANPDVFDPARAENPHLAFGRGVHFCVGAPLARLEGRVALNILFDRFPRLATVPGELPQFLTNPNMTGVRSLPLSVA
jgi:cytochrome P450